MIEQRVYNTRMNENSLRRLIVASTVLMFTVGCTSTSSVRRSVDTAALRQQAFQCLQSAIQYTHNPAVRTLAVEALQHSQSDRALPWLRTALKDEHPAVRFASCVAVGVLKDALSSHSVRDLLQDKNASVQLAALFAMHRLGDTSDTGKIPNYLLQSEDVMVRRNAALLLGFMEEPQAIKVLARAMKDRDIGVRHHALEAMARLGNKEAAKELAFMANAGVGSEEVFALQALASTRDQTYIDTFRYKLGTAQHIETRLAAAYGLGRFGSHEGFDYARHALTRKRPILPDPNDPPSGQILRAQQLAMLALGAIGDVSVLSLLDKVMKKSDDPRIQVSAARAILEILAAQPSADSSLVTQSQQSKG